LLPIDSSLFPVDPSLLSTGSGLFPTDPGLFPIDSRLLKISPTTPTIVRTVVEQVANSFMRGSRLHRFTPRGDFSGHWALEIHGIWSSLRQ
jgi:hypothetical protein